MAPTIDYRSPGTVPTQRSTSARVSVVTSAMAVVVGVAAYAILYRGSGPTTMFHAMAMGLVLFFFCAPAFLTAAIAAIVSARSKTRDRRMLATAWILVAVQGVFWAVMIVGSIIDASTSGGSRRAPGGF